MRVRTREYLHERGQAGRDTGVEERGHSLMAMLLV